MIVKVASASRFGVTARYLERGRAGHEVDRQERVEWVSSRNLAGTDDPELAGHLMHATADANRRVQDPACHVKVSFAPEDRPRLGRERMEGIADQLIERMRLEEHQVLMVAHKDTDHPHFHLLVNRVHPEHGRAWDRYPRLPPVGEGRPTPRAQPRPARGPRPPPPARWPGETVESQHADRRRRRATAPR